MAIPLVCPTCGTELEHPGATNPGIIHCGACTDKLLWTDDEALTYLDDIPEDEFLGG